MSLTFKAAQVALADYVSPDRDLNQYINLACERLINSGKWKGTLQRLLFQVDSTGILTLPRDFVTVEGVKVENYQRPLANQWYEFVPGSSSWTQNCSSNVQCEGDGYSTFKDLAKPSYLKVTCARFDSGDKIVTVVGPDSNNQLIYKTDGSPGEDLEINGAKSTALFSSIAGVVKPVTQSILSLIAVDPDDNSETVIGLYQPGETSPSYRRYFVREASAHLNGGSGTITVTAFCKRRYVPAVADNDFLFTSNEGALKNALLCLHYEDEADTVRSEVQLRRAVKLLNDELKSYRAPNEQGVLKIRAFGQFAGTGIPNLM